MRLLNTWRAWRRRRRLRLDYRQEVLHLRRELALMQVQMGILERLLIIKQEKINRILDGTAGTADRRPEKAIESYEQIIKGLSNDFEKRQQSYERTGRYDAQEEATTREPRF